MSLSVLDVTPGVACCPPLAVQALPAEAAVQLAPLFKALSDPVRLRLVSLIASTDEVCVCDLTDAFELTGATISHHLRVLREAGLVDCERRGTWVYYWIKGEVLGRLSGLLQSATPGLAPIQHQSSLISEMPDVVRLLSDPLRARIVEVLADGPASTSEVVAATGAKQPNVSGHLKQLREAGLVVAEQRGRFTYYRVVPEALEATADQLAGLAARARISGPAAR